MTSVADVPRNPDRAAFDRLAEALEAADCRPRIRGTKIDALCPAHEDSTPSLSADWKPELRGGGAGVLITCHAGCETADVAAALGWQFPQDLYDTPLYRSDAAAAPRSARTAKPKKKPAAKQAKPAPRLGPVVATYTYTDEHGEILGEVRRHDPKTFRWVKPGARGGMVWGAPERRPLYRLPAVLAAIAAGETVFVVEGEKDADAIETAGACGTCNPGGASKAGQRSKWLPEHTEALRGARVVIVRDRDEVGRAHADHVAAELADVADSVEIREPIVGKDVADHLAVGHDLAELAAVPAAEPTPDSGNGATVHHVDFRRETPAPSPEEEHRGGSGGDGPPPATIIPITRTRYEVVDGCLAKIKPAAKSATQLLNGVVKLKARVRRDLGDGSRITVSHVDLEAETRDDEDELVTGTMTGVEWADFEKCTWTPELPWSDVVYTRTSAGKSDLVNAILSVSGPRVPTVTAYGTLGWRHDSEADRWFYVHAGGAIDQYGPRPDVRTDIDNTLAEYTLPDPVTDPAAIKEGLQASLDIFEKLPPRFAAPMLGAAYRSVLGACNATLFLVGGKHSFKSSLAALGLSHLKPKATHENLTLGAGEEAATSTGLEEIRFLAGDTLVVADDLAPDRGTERASQRANALARSQYNRTGKVKGRREGGLRPTHRPRGLQVLTGEDGASAPSAESRVVYVPHAPGDLDKDAIIGLTSTAAGLQRATWMSTMIKYFAARQPLEDWLIATKSRLFADLFDDDSADAGGESRTVGLVADLAVGWCAMLQAAVDLDAMTKADAAALWDRVWAGLVEAKRAQSRVTESRSVPTRAADLLRAAIMSGRAHVVSTAGGLPIDATDLWGWENPPVSAPDGVEARPLGETVGWTDGATLWLEKPAAFAAIERQGRSVSEPLGITMRKLGADLASAGVITTRIDHGQPKNDARLRLSGALRTVWEMPVSWLYAEDTPPDSTESAPEPPAGPEPTQPPLMPQDAPERVSEPSEDTPSGAEAGGQQQPKETTTMAPRPASRSRKTSANYASPAVVLSADYAVMPTNAGGMDFPDQPETVSLPALVDWAADLNLGWHHDYASDDEGQLWLMPDVAAKVGLATEPERGTAAAKNHPAVKALTAAGWQVSKAGIEPWFRVWREGERALRIIVVGWVSPQETPLVAKDPKADEPVRITDAGGLAWRIRRYAGLVGLPWRMSGGVTGIDLMETIRPPKSRLGLPEPVAAVDPAKSPGTERDIAWQRKPTAGEWTKKFAHLYDKNGMYAPAAGAAELGRGPATHLADHPEFDPKVPGYHRMRRQDLAWERPYLPDLFDPSLRGMTDTVWRTTSTLKMAAQLGYGIRPLESYVYTTHARALEPWYKQIKAAREALIGTTNPDEAAVLAAIKRTYAAGIGRLGAPGTEGDNRYRPDHRHEIIATARANMMRNLIAAADETQMHPLAVATDAVVYLSDDPNPESACPLKMGNALGEFKHVGSAKTEDVAKLLDREGRIRTDAGIIIEMEGRHL